MKIHEYQGKELLRQFGVPVPRGYPAFSVREASEAAQKLGGSVWVVKAQIHAGGRGKGGGVKLARSHDEVQSLAGQILGMQLTTHQTSPAGQKVQRFCMWLNGPCRYSTRICSFGRSSVTQLRNVSRTSLKDTVMSATMTSMPLSWPSTEAPRCRTFKPRHIGTNSG